MLTFDGYALTPGHHDEFFTQEAQLTWGRWDQQKIFQALLDKDTVDSGNGTTTTKLRPGLALGVLSSGQLTHWNPLSDMETAAQGSRDFVGFFQENMEMEYGGAGKERLIYCLVGGNIKAGSIVIPGNDYGVSGEDYEILLREAAAPNFLFDDDLNRTVARKALYTMTAAEIAANSVTLTAADHNTDIVLYDANATTTLVLPAPIPGLRFHVHPFDYDITVDGPATGEFQLDRDGSAVNGDTFPHAGNLSAEILGVAVTDSTFKYITLGGVPA